MTQPQDFFDANRANWNDRADIHIRDTAGFYAIDVLLAGGVVLTPIEQAEVGNLTGLKVAHFQCHIGTDTLSLKRLGAGEVVGLDFSSAALKHARELARKTALDVRFVEGSVFDAESLLGTGYDLVFTSWGTVCWLNDLDAWARAAAAVLKPGGRLYFADAHPVASMFESDGEGRIKLVFDYETPPDNPVPWDEETTYDGSGLTVTHTRTYAWNHSVSRILNAMMGAGFAIEFVHEHDALPWGMFDTLVQGEDRLFRWPEGRVRMPLAWSVGARVG